MWHTDISTGKIFIHIRKKFKKKLFKVDLTKVDTRDKTGKLEVFLVSEK